MKETKEGRQFRLLVKEEREKQGFSLERLCEGVCSPDRARAMESGKWVPGKFLQEYILDRLGVGAEDYEYYFQYNEYRQWRARQDILHSITFGKPRQAGRRLAAYRAAYGTEDAAERQFFLAMRAQIRRCRGGTGEELSALYEEAVRLTMPAAGRKPLGEMVLSVKELNLLLEAEQYRREGERRERYQEIVDYIQDRNMDKWNMAKIYPKAVYFLCRCAAAEGESAQTLERLLGCCRHAVDVLREGERMYYLWELLELQGRIAGAAAKELARQGDREPAEGMERLCGESARWKRELEEVYRQYKVPKETCEYCYLYVMRGVCCLGDTVRIRREMLGMSRKELSRGICSEKTLGRLERRQTKAQRAVAEELLERLGLPVEFGRTDLATADRRARDLMSELRNLSNDGQWDEAERLRERIRKMVPMEMRWNQQTIKSREALDGWKKKEIGREEYLEQMREALKMTMPYKAFLKEGKKYLTHREQTCIQSMMFAMDEQSEEYLTCMLRFEEMYGFYTDRELQETVAGMYEFVMGNVSSYWGNRGEYDRSDLYNERIIEGCLRFRRMGMLHAALYDRWWNYDKRKSEGIPNDKVLDDVEELTRCICFSRMVRHRNRVKFYREKLEAVTKSQSINSDIP